MKNLNRWIYAIVGVIVLLLAGLVYAWSTMAKSIGSYTGWDAAQLSAAFTLVMAFFLYWMSDCGCFCRESKSEILYTVIGYSFLCGIYDRGLYR